MNESGTGEARSSASRRVAALLVLVGAALLASGFSGLGSAAATAYVGGAMFVWTVLLPRLPSLRVRGVFFASHSLAAGAYWAALMLGSASTTLVGPPGQLRFSMGLLFLSALVAGALALGAGLVLEARVRTGGARTRRALAVAVVAVIALTPALIAPLQGEAPLPVERLRAAPVVGHVSAGQRVARGSVAIFRSADGSFQPVQPGNLEWLVSRGPDAFASDQGGEHVCRRIEADAAIEIRELPGVLVYTAPGALEDPEAVAIAGCAYRAGTLEQVALRASDLPGPLSAGSRIYVIVFGAWAVALIQLVLAALALVKHRRLASAREGVSDGHGLVRLAEGAEVRCSAPTGPALVRVEGSTAEQYRVNAISSASFVAAGTRAEAARAMHLSTCTALVGALGALLASALPLAAALLAGLVAPLG